jgi:hypothetical protein
MNAHIADTVIVLDELAGIGYVTEFDAFQGFVEQIAISGCAGLLAGNEQTGLEWDSRFESAIAVDAADTYRIAYNCNIGIKFHEILEEIQ